jgi:DNA repair exonuclease SbcCD ATPase subunit
MWSPIHLIINNLFSYKDVKFEFNSGKTTLVYGSNKTDDGALSNGSGKSSLIDSISLAITGDVLRDIVKKDIIRNNEKSGEVEILLSNKMLNKDLKIIRRLYTSKSSDIEIWENGVIRSDLKDMHPKESDKAILDYLDISKDDLTNYYLITKGKYTSFFLSNDSSKKEVINRFSKANIIDPIDETIKKDILSIDVVLSSLDKDKTSLTSKLDVYKQQLINESNNDIEKQREDNINRLKSKIVDNKSKVDLINTDSVKLKLDISNDTDLLKTFDSSKEESEVSNLKVTIQDLESQISLLKTDYNNVEIKYKPDFDKIDEYYKNIENDISKYKSEIKEINIFISTIEKNLADEIECPKCTHKFILRDKSYNIEEARNALPGYEDRLTELNSLILTSNDKLSKLDGRRVFVKENVSKDQSEITIKAKSLKSDIDTNEQKISDLQIIIRNINSKKSSTENYIKSSTQKLESYIKDISFFNEDNTKTENLIKSEIDRVYENKSILINEQISKIESSLLELDLNIESKKVEKTKVFEWQLRFKKFKSFLANNSLVSIESYSNYYLKQMKTNLTTVIDGFRELSNGKIKEEISVMVSRDNLISENFNKFSGGEKSKCDLSCIFAMQKLINLTSSSGGLDFIFIDEVLESIDSEGLKDVVNALSNLNQTIMMITHVDPDKYFDCDKLLVEKVNGISLLV